MKNSSQRVGVFVDTANIYHSVRHLYKSNVNFAELLKKLIGSRELIRAIAYTVSADVQKEKDFLTALEKSGFEVKSKALQLFPGGLKKGNWDVGMAVDAIKMSHKFDVAIIVSGDGDFVDLVQFLQHEGVYTEVAAFGPSTSNELKAKCDKFIDLDKEKHLLIKTGSQSKSKNNPYGWNFLEKQ